MAQTFHDTEAPAVQFPGIDIELSKVLHASEAVTVPGPIPPSSRQRARCSGRRGGRSSPAARAASRGPWAFDVVRTSRAGTRLRTGHSLSPQQALLYRMCGDRNPLHSSPEFAAAAGFPRPILHGLCTYGMTAKAMTDLLLDGDTSRVGSYGARFAGVVFPGEMLKVSIWKEWDGFPKPSSPHQP